MNARRLLAGATLLEVLVAMGLGVTLLMVMATVHARVLVISADAARAADAQDTLRIALAVLEYELQHAGYWGMAPDAARISGRRGDDEPLEVAVAGDCGPDWTIDLDRPVEAWAGWPLACTAFGGAAPASPVLVLRRVDTRVSAPDAGLLQVHSDPWSGHLTVSGEPAVPGSEIRDLVVRAYYVSPRSTADPSRPSLRRKTLQRGPRIVDEEVVPGVAAFELELGIDTDPPGAPGHGMPNRFVSPGAANGSIVALRILLRADDPSRFSLVRTVPLRNGSAT
jgi:type IV pilus assembly protein PilW